MPRLLHLAAAWLLLVLGAARAEARSPSEPEYRASDRAAVESYRRGDLESARALWERCLAAPELADAPDERARVLFDLGNCAYRQKQLLESVGWYSAALRLRPRDSDTWANLEQARSDARLEPADRGDLLATLGRLVTALTLDEARWLALVATVAWALVLAGEALFGGRRWAWLARLATLGVVLALVPWQVQRVRLARHELLVVSATPAALQSEPRPDATELGQLAPGDVVRYLDELPDWIKVEGSGERGGWVARGALFDLRR